MMHSPMPVVFQPIFKPKPWGGRSLERLFGKALPAESPIGESWELSDLAGNESCVGRGPLAGVSIRDLIREWGAELLGSTPLMNERFPLLIKFLDAREALSLQVHPRSKGKKRTAERAPEKDEAWFVIDADPSAELHIGAKPGITNDDVVAAIASDRLQELLISRPVWNGDCYYLPSGVPHALGAGLVVAEIQTPVDVTYRLYDWGRVGLDGRPRELHVEQALANIRYDVAETEIVQPRRMRIASRASIERVATCERFSVERVRAETGVDCTSSSGEMRVLILLNGRLITRGELESQEFYTGDVVLLPAALPSGSVETATDCEFLDVRAGSAS